MKTIIFHHVRQLSISQFLLLKTKVLSAAAPERVDNISAEKLHSIIKDQGGILLR